MSSEWWVIAVLLGLLLVVILVPVDLGNLVLFNQTGLANRADGALVFWRDRSMLAFTLAWFSLLGLMSIATEGLARILMCAVSCAGVLATALAYRHKLILTDDRMSLQSWRRFEARRSEINSCHVERSDENGIIWIDIHTQHGRCRLGQTMIFSSEQQNAMLSFLDLEH
jgi:hypothetical protein